MYHSPCIFILVKNKLMNYSYSLYYTLLNEITYVKNLRMLFVSQFCLDAHVEKIVNKNYLLLFKYKVK